MLETNTSLRARPARPGPEAPRRPARCLRSSTANEIRRGCASIAATCVGKRVEAREAAVCDARARADSDDATLLAAATTSGVLVASGPNHKAVSGVHSGALTLAQRRARGAQAFHLRQAADAKEQIARWIVEKRFRPSDGPSADERREDVLDRLRKRQRTDHKG